MGRLDFLLHCLNGYSAQVGVGSIEGIVMLQGASSCLRIQGILVFTIVVKYQSVYTWLMDCSLESGVMVVLL